MGAPRAKSMLPHFGQGEGIDWVCSLGFLTERHLLFIGDFTALNLQQLYHNRQRIASLLWSQKKKELLPPTKAAVGGSRTLNFVRVLEPHPDRWLFNRKEAGQRAAKQRDGGFRVVNLGHPVDVGLVQNIGNLLLGETLRHPGLWWENVAVFTE